jgi:hypothetical protein
MYRNRSAAQVSRAFCLLVVGLVVGVRGGDAWGQAPIRETHFRLELRQQPIADRRAEELSAAAAAYQRHEYALQNDGNLLGKVQTVDDLGPLIPARVRLYFVRRGAVVTHALPDETGTFQATGLSPGYYSVVAAGQGGFSAVAVRILPPPERPEPPKANTIGQTTTIAREKAVNDGEKAANNRGVRQSIVPIPLNLSTIQPIDVRPAFYLAQRYVPGMALVSTPYRPASPNSPGPSNQTVRRAPAVGAPSIKARTVAADSSDTSELTALTEAAVEAYERHQFPTNPDGTLSGQLRMVDTAGTSVPANVMLFFLRGGQVVSQANVQANGNFATQPLEPGYYSVVAAGPSGFAAAGLRVVASVQPLPVPKANTISNTRTISEMQNGGIPLNLAPIPVDDISQIQEIAQVENPGGIAGALAGGTVPPAGGAALAGGTVGGAAAGGAGGGLGALVGAGLAAGVGGGIAAATDGGGGGSTSITTTVTNSPTTPGSSSTTGSGGSGSSGGTTGGGSLTTGSSSGGAGVTLTGGTSTGGGTITVTGGSGGTTLTTGTGGALGPVTSTGS